MEYSWSMEFLNCRFQDAGFVPTLGRTWSEDGFVLYWYPRFRIKCSTSASIQVSRYFVNKIEWPWMRGWISLEHVCNVLGLSILSLSDGYILLPLRSILVCSRNILYPDQLTCQNHYFRMFLQFFDGVLERMCTFLVPFLSFRMGTLVPRLFH